MKYESPRSPKGLREHFPQESICSSNPPELLTRLQLKKLLNQREVVFSALSDLTRRLILVLLTDNETMRLAHVAKHFPTTSSMVGRHLVYLADAGLVTRERVGMSVNYSIVNGEETDFLLDLLGGNLEPRNDKFFDAIADSVRRKLLINFLEGHKKNVTELADQFSISKPPMSRHLNILLAAGFLTKEEVGTAIYFALQDFQ